MLVPYYILKKRNFLQLDLFFFTKWLNPMSRLVMSGPSIRRPVFSRLRYMNRTWMGSLVWRQETRTYSIKTDPWRDRTVWSASLLEREGQSEHQHFKRCSIDVLSLSKTPSGEITNVVSDFFSFYVWYTTTYTIAVSYGLFARNVLL